MYRVIVIDDEPEFRSWLRSTLESSGDFQVVGDASNGDEAISLVTQVLPDIVIADIYMPGIDGFEVAQYLQQHFPSVRTILISVHEESIYQRLAKEKGAIKFIPKAQFSLDALRYALQGERKP